MDEGIGNLTKTLKASKIWDNTLIIFSSDHGGFPSKGGSNLPLRGNAGEEYEGGW